jgi:hypothetical protein
VRGRGNFRMVSELMKGWQPDPFGLHEFRFFSDDGKPTLLVRDGSVRAYDPPPSTGGALFVRPVQSEPECELRPSVVWQEPEKPATNGGARSRSVAVASPPRPAPRPVDGRVHPVPMTSKPAKVAYVVVLAIMAASALALAVVHFTQGGKPAGSSAASTTSTTSPPGTSSTTTSTTTLPVPAALQPSAAVAAADLISSWASGDRAEALSVATAPAVATLFAGHYTPGLVIDRGCSVAFSPIVCTYGPPGGASPTDPIYEIYVIQALGGWYVRSATIDN